MQFVVSYKRLHRALFVLPRAADDTLAGVRIDGAALATLLAGVEKTRGAREKP